MTGSQDLSELLERVEGATGADQELDALILCALAAPSGAFAEKSRFNGEWCIYTAPDRLWERSARNGWWREGGWPLTSSLDAALALAERALPEWNPNLRKIAHPGAPNAWWESSVRISPLTTYVAECDTPALAILNALLKALQAQASDTQHGSQS